MSVNLPLLCKTAPIDYTDPLLELLPEAYVDSPEPSEIELGRAVAQMVREHAAFLPRRTTQRARVHGGGNVAAQWFA